ncbi:unnamed protein product [Allacma fusca]|uniref:Rap-GAP domain-containing protein n=1 Tax=Allacma fusca TaxID=39272 RepID=A0A8J2L9K8_9HEXA|nr:unnamed protein product [Allacma fusca]
MIAEGTHHRVLLDVRVLRIFEPCPVTDRAPPAFPKVLDIITYYNHRRCIGSGPHFQASMTPLRNIVTTLGISQPPLPSPFTTDKEIEWNLQVICFGLSLPLSDHEIIKDCVSIYCEWLSCLAPIPKICVPKPVTDRPNFFARKMINHLYHLFAPRKGEFWPFLYQENLVQDTINRQAVLCHRVLRTLQSVIKTSEILDAETWECILLFLISINDALLSPPSIKEDIGDQLCDRVLSVLFEVWLLACAKSFPSPPLWKTLRDACRSWRHRSNLFDHWSRINLLLTGQVLHIMYGKDYIKLDDDNNFIPRDISNDCVVQTWFRFLHCVGNPVELTQPTIISQTQNFLQYAIASEAVVDPCQHPCLSVLPGIFLQAMKGISTLVDAFLGVPPARVKSLDLNASSDSQESQGQANNPSPIPPMRRLAKSFSVAPSSNANKGLPRTSLLGLTSRSKDTSSIPSSSQSSSLQSSGSVSLSAVDIASIRPLPSPLRPRVNSILHLFGPWLFEAALISCDMTKLDGEVRRTSRGSAVPAALPESIDIPLAITIDKYYLGRAEALGTLCRIFCSKKTGEEILPAYLARFYIAIRKGLRDTRNDVLGSILSNSPNLFRVDLDGVNILVPAIVSALEMVLPVKDAIRHDLRRPAIQLLLSLLPLPLHFLNVPIKEIGDKGTPSSTFLQLKPRLANLLINTLQVETDSMNIQMLLGGLMLFVTDTAAFEELEKSCLGTESPTNLLSSENTSIRSLSEYSNSFDDHALGFYDPMDSSFDSAHALFVRTTYLTCHRLISTWKTDLTVSLAALELLNGLAKTRVQEQDPLECRRAVKWICDFIIHQCSRPPPAHSKDLHSSIVAAFQCVTTWLTSHPFLLEDKESLSTVLEVVEYGISGTKSVGKPGEPIKYKDEKNQNPVSLRVRDAAEALLAVIFEQVGGQCINDSVKPPALVDEFTLLAQVCSPGSLTKQEVINHFRYYVIDHSILIAMLEEPLVNDQDPQPTVTAVLRGPTGKHSWSLQLRYMARNKGKSFGSSPGNNPGRPLPMNDVGIRHEIQQRYFPENADRISTCKADKAIPPLELSSSDGDSLEQSRLSIILENQIRLEKRVATMIKEELDESYQNLRSECVPPPPSQEFQTARLLLSHLGFISVQNQTDFTFPKLVAIDSKHIDFATELDGLDATSCRTCDTVHVFYVRAGQRKAQDILNNVLSKNNVHPHFMEFLLTLGWPVTVSKHSAWTGNIHSSWKRLNLQLLTNEDEIKPLMNENHGGSAYNGEKQVLYWADTTSEIAFVVPTSTSGPSVWNVNDTAGALGSQNNDEKSPPRARLTSSDTDKHSGAPEENLRSRKSLAGKNCDIKIFVVWLESFEDSFHFPSAELMAYSITGMEGNPIPSEPTLIIFIQAMRNGLFRIHMEGQSLRMGFATPLIDGMVLSRRVLGSLVRQTALNMAKRKRLESENFQPPHVRRKLKIQEILQKFPCKQSEPDFYTDFFKSLTPVVSV